MIGPRRKKAVRQGLSLEGGEKGGREGRRRADLDRPGLGWCPIVWGPSVLPGTVYGLNQGSATQGSNEVDSIVSIDWQGAERGRARLGEKGNGIASRAQRSGKTRPGGDVDIAGRGGGWSGPVFLLFACLVLRLVLRLLLRFHFRNRFYFSFHISSTLHLSRCSVRLREPGPFARTVARVGGRRSSAFSKKAPGVENVRKALSSNDADARWISS